MGKTNWAMVVVLTGMALLYGGAGDAPPRGMTVPSYTEDGALRRPEGYEKWMFLGASLGLSYAENTSREPPGQFHNVYIQPEAFEHYRRTGRFPEKTMLALALHEPRQKESINRDGYFQGNLEALEIALKDSAQHPESWGYYDFGGGEDLKETSTPFAQDTCYSCHLENAEDDNVFVQFYPVMQRIRAERGQGGRGTPPHKH
jgi:Cytochrome P460